MPFKIRNRDGLFATGGDTVTWSKSGKTWAQRGHLSSHFTQLRARCLKDYELAGAEVIEYEMVVKSVEPTTVWVTAAVERREAKETQRKEASLKWQRDAELKELKRLKEKYGA